LGHPTYILAGGGTGGHLYPGLAVARELRELRPEAVIVMACSDRTIDAKVLADEPYAVVAQPVRPLPRGGRGWGGFLKAWAASHRLARDMLRDLKPAAVLGLGGFAAGPLVTRAGRAGVRTGLLNPDAVPGVANRWIARHAEAIFTQFETTRAHFGRARDKVRAVGCPIRREFAAADRAQALSQFGLRPDRRTLLVCGGSLGAASINAAVAALLGHLEPLAGAWQVLHITGSSSMKAVDGEADGKLHVRRMEYCHEMPLAYAAADLALGRAGANTVAELAATGTPAVLMPYPHHKDMHQKLNAAALVECGAAVLVDDRISPAENVASLRAAMLGLMDDAGRLAEMASAAKSLGAGDAAAEVARWLADV